ncbi:MAG TPA: AAA family ATPase [Solirubrobacteraceae bacterium]|nr:AAA family ATPase [Solirubrobacteraceae bacterium]
MGRARELARLERALDGALDGRGELFLLTGDAGIGKTALAREFVEHASERGAAWAWGSCWDGGGAPAYWPWVQVARTLVRRADMAYVRDALGAGAPWIAHLLPELADTLGAPAQPSELDSDQARFRLFDALATLLATVAGQRPLVIVLDDLHWADVSSLLALEFVARALPEAPLLVVAAYRDVEAHARPELAASLGGLARVAARLPLEGLDRTDVGRLAAARAQGLGGAERDPIPAGLVTAVHDASAGNPFFVDELLQLLSAQGRLHDARAAQQPLPLPDGVRDAIRGRLEPLAAPVLRALSAAAVIGGTFTLHTLAGVVERPQAEVLEALELPLRDGIVVATSDPGRFVFAHALVRDTLVDGLGAVRRARLHLLAAEALEVAYRDDLEPHLAEIAHHYLQASTEGGAERAVDYAARAAARAVGQFANDEAARLYEQALDVASALAPDEARAWRLAQGLGEARMRAGDIEGARRALRAAAEHARRLDDAERLAQTALASTLGAFAPGLVEGELVATLEEALARIDAFEPPVEERRAAVDALRCRLRVQLALALYWSPQRERREQLVEEAMTLARAIDAAARPDVAEQRTLAERTLAFALAQGFVAVWGPDTVTRGLPISVEAQELCSRSNDAELGMLVRLWRTSLLLELDDPVRADEEIAAFGTIARRLGQPRMLVFDPLHRALAAQLRGDLATAEALTTEAFLQAQEIPGSIAPMVVDAQMCFVRRMQGRQADIEPYVRRNADRLPEIPRWRCGLALILAELGRTDEARRELEHLAAQAFDDIPRDALWLVSMSLLAELCALLDDHSRARRLYELLVPYDGRNVVSMGGAYLGPVARYLALLAMTIGEHDRALGHLETAHAGAERMGARPIVALTALDTAEVLVRREGAGDAQRARTLIQHAGGDADEMQMPGLAARAARLRERLGEASRPAHRAAGRRTLRAALRREQDVWLLDYEGRSVWLRDAKGLHHLAALFESPGTAIASVALARRLTAGDSSPAPVLGSQRVRAIELREEIAEARAFNDPERAAGARHELEALAADVAERREAAGAGADRASNADGERARVNVTRAIKAAVVRIAEHEPELGHLLRGSVRTGSSCAYQPDPAMPLHWDVHR